MIQFAFPLKESIALCFLEPVANIWWLNSIPLSLAVAH